MQVDIFRARTFRPVALLAVAGGIALAIACGRTETTVVEVTRVVERPVEVEKTVVVEKTVEVTKEVEKVVQQTVVVEKPVDRVVIQTATATVVPKREPANPKAPDRTAVIAIADLGGATGVTGLNRTGGAGANFNIGEALYIPAGPTGSDVSSPWLAEKWTLASDLSKVTINVKKGVQFHKGFGEMTATDVAWSYNDLISDTSIHTSAGRYRSIFDKMSVVDQHVVEIPFKTFSVEWNSSMLNVFISPMEVFSKKAFDQNGEAWSKDNPVGTGAYEVKEYKPKDLLRLEAVPNHHFRTAQMTNLSVREVPEEATRLAMIKTGEADIADISLKNIRSLLEDGYKTSDSGKSGQIGIFFTGTYWEDVDFNCANGNRSPSCPTLTPGTPETVQLKRTGYKTELPWIGEFGNAASMEKARLVRTAMSLAIDRDVINEAILDGLGWPVHIGGFSIFSPHWDKKWETPYDPALAKKLLDEAGWTAKAEGVRFSLDLYAGPHAGGPTGTGGEVQDAVGGMWAKVGIRTNLQKVAYAAYRPTVVDRSSSVPWTNACGGSDARDSVPWDFPKGIAFSSLSRGGFNCGQEIRFAAENFTRVAKEPDLNKRIQYNTEWLEYLHHWRLNSGILVVPEPLTWNPKKVKEWQMRANASGTHIVSFDMIVPAK